MGFRINTNIGALNAHANAVVNNRMLEDSLSKLSSGLRINKAADDASGMAIADSLRSQATSLAQAIANANDAIGIIQTADKAMDEQLKILDIVKAKSIQAASDSQSTNSRLAIQKDVNRLLEQLDNIARTTSFNGQALLSGQYENKEFQVGAYSNQTVKVSVKDTQSTVIGKILTTNDHTSIGNTLQTAHSTGHVQPLSDFKTGTKEIYLADLNLGPKGLGKGDVIKFMGDDTEYTIDAITSAGAIILGGGIQQDMPVGTQMYIVDNAQPKEFLSFSTGAVTADANAASIDARSAEGVSVADVNYTNLRGLAKGDIISYTTSTGVTGEARVNVVQTSAGGGISLASINNSNLADLGAAAITTVKQRATFDNEKFKLYAPAATGDNIRIQATAATASEGLATGAFNGLGVGDKITIGENKQVLTIRGFEFSTGAILFVEKLDNPVVKGDKIVVVEPAKELLGFGNSAAVAHSEQTIKISMAAMPEGLKGVAKGDVVQSVLSNGDVVSVTVNRVVVSDGAITLSFADTIANLTSDQTSLTAFNAYSWTLQSSATLGKDFTSTDYAQYTIEGIKLPAVQMTDENGNGVANTGMGEVANLINSVSDKTNVKAVPDVSAQSKHKIHGGVLQQDITINGNVIVKKGTKLLEADTDEKLTNAINAKTDVTGVKAEYDPRYGTIKLVSDGRVMNLKGFTTVVGINDGVHPGRIQYVQQDPSIVEVSAKHYQDAALTKSNDGVAGLSVRQKTEPYTLRDVVTKENIDGTSGLLRTREDSMTAMNIVETAIRALDAVRADLGAVQNQFVVTINNISVTRVNVQAAESQIRDVDFAAESASFSKHNILAQSGSFAMAQANAIQQNVLKLLQ